ncbi:MAG TPA: efflux RND transporter periplasmic adaptor subunit [Rhizomicrobium sp.]|jgi:RND family efflux transporter MFP subunit|nr:efflux RND transporter periplasmic adaptor subunit [Rhizomicrobium sp.]
MRDTSDPLRYQPPRRLKIIGIVAVCVAALIALVGIVSRVMANREVHNWGEANALPIVSTVNLNTNGKEGQLVLPGNVQAFNAAPIYARVSGYLKKWYVDIGAPVKAGQLLAEIDVPDQDQQLAQAKADLATAIANEKLSAQTAVRWNMLEKQNAVAQQDVDEKNGDLAAKQAAVASAQANVDRLADLENFKRIVAPFDGTVTSRSVDVGALVTVGTPGATPLFTVSDDSKVRIYVSVPQSYSAQIQPGMVAQFTVPEYPGKTFTATLVTTARAVNAATGAVLVQLQADNPDKQLKPGDYAQVQFNLPAGQEKVRLPASALVFNDSGSAVATLGPGNRVRFKPVTISRDYGTSVEIASGLTRSDRVIDNPPDSLRSGDQVRISARRAVSG